MPTPSVPTISLVSSPGIPAPACNGILYVFSCTNPNTSPGSASGPVVHLLVQAILDGEIFSQPYATSDAATMTAFYTAYASALSAIGIVVTNPSSAVLVFTFASGTNYAVVSAGTGGALTPSSVSDTSVTYTLSGTISGGDIEFIFGGISQATQVVEANPSDGYYYYDPSDFVMERFAAKGIKTIVTEAGTNFTQTDVPNAVVNLYLNVFAEVQTTSGYNSSYPVLGTNTTGGVFPNLNITNDYSTCTNIMFALNAALQHTDTQNLNNYIAAGSGTQSFLTKAPLKKWVGLNENAALSFYHTATTDAYKFTVKRYNLDGTLKDTTKSSELTQVTNSMAMSAIGPKQLNETLFLASEIDNTILYYTVYVENSSATMVTEIRTFYIDQNTKNDISGALDYIAQKTLYWLNSLGGVDSFTFTGRFSEAQQNEIKEYQKYLASGFAIPDRGFAMQWVRSIGTFILESNWLNKETFYWLSSELLASPMVFMQDYEYSGFPAMVPVNVMTKNAPMSESNDPMNFLALEMKYANVRVVQIG